MLAISAFLKGFTFGFISSLIGCIVYAGGAHTPVSSVLMQNRFVVLGISLVCGIIWLGYRYNSTWDVISRIFEAIDPFSFIWELFRGIFWLLGEIFSAW